MKCNCSHSIGLATNDVCELFIDMFIDMYIDMHLDIYCAMYSETCV